MRVYKLTVRDKKTGLIEHEYNYYLRSNAVRDQEAAAGWHPGADILLTESDSKGVFV